MLSKRSVLDIKDVKLNGETITRDLSNSHSIVHDITLSLSGLKYTIAQILKDTEDTYYEID